MIRGLKFEKHCAGSGGVGVGVLLREGRVFQGFPSIVSLSWGLEKARQLWPTLLEGERQNKGFISPTGAGKALRQGDSGSGLQEWAGFAPKGEGISSRG